MAGMLRERLTREFPLKRQCTSRSGDICVCSQAAAGGRAMMRARVSLCLHLCLCL